MLLKFKETLFPPENPRDLSKIAEIFEAIVDGNSNFLSQVSLPEVRDLTFTNHGRNILHVAVWYNCLTVIDAICKNNALKTLMNEKDLNAETPLHLAVYTKNFEAYKRLVRAGANVQVTNNKKERAIDLLDDSPASTEFLKSILNTENLFTSIPNDQQTEIKKRLDQQPKIAFKVTLIPTETEVNCDEGGLTKKFSNKTSLVKEDNDETRSIMERNTDSIANIVPSLTYGEAFTASRKNIKGGTWLSNPNSATARLFKDSTQMIEKSDKSLTNNLLDPHSHNRLSFLYKKDDDVTPEHANGINQFSGISNIFEPSKNSNSTSKRSSLFGSKSEINNA